MKPTFLPAPPKPKWTTPSPKLSPTTGATSMKQMGGVVKAAKDALTGKSVDGKALSDRVREKLSKLA